MVNINYKVSDDFLTVKPEHRQAAGVMGQAKACTVTFKVPAWVWGGKVRIEYVDTTGKLFTTDEEGYNELLVTNRLADEVSVVLPWQWTVYGGTAFVRLVAYTTDTDGVISSMQSTPDRALLFENSKTGDDLVVRRSLAQLVVDGHATVKQTDDLYKMLLLAKENGEFDGEDGHTPVKGKDYFTEADQAEMIEKLLPFASMAAVHIGGEPPTDPNTKVWINPYGSLDVAVLCSPQKLTDEQKAQAKANLGLGNGEAIVIDEALSLDSTNPVQNKVVAKAIKSAMLKGVDPVPSLADDTPDFWRNLGAGAWEITGAGYGNIVDGGTFFMGTILNMPASNYVFQVVFTPIAQTAYFRTAASGNTWNSTWKTLTPTKQELVQGVLDALPTWEGGAY